MNANSTTIRYRKPMVNYYVNDLEGLATFYCNNFGFEETFRAIDKDTVVHIEVRLDGFILGLASIGAAKAMHNLPLNPGLPRAEVALWADDVDEVYAALTANGIRCISAPHNFLETPPLRAAWFADPEGNHIQVVCRRKSSDR